MFCVSWLQHLLMIGFSEAVDLPGKVKSSVMITQGWTRASELVLVLLIVQALKLNFTLFVNRQLWLEQAFERIDNDQKLGKKTQWRFSRDTRLQEP